MRRFEVVFLAAVLGIPAQGVQEGGTPQAWARPVELERGIGYFGIPHAIPLGIASLETPDGEAVAVLYGVRTENSDRYAVYIQWSLDGGGSWQGRRLLGQATWVATGEIQTLSVRLARFAGKLCVVGAWENPNTPEDPNAPQTVRLHGVSPGEERLLVEFALPSEGPQEARWIHRLEISAVGGRDVIWGVRGRGTAEGAAPRTIEIQPFHVVWEGPGREAPAIVPLGPWRPSSRGWVTDTLALSAGADGQLGLEGFDLAEGGWVAQIQHEGAPVRMVDDLLNPYMATEALVVRCCAWPAQPDWRLVSYLEGSRARTVIVRRCGARWIVDPLRWEQPCYVWDFDARAERCAFSCVLGTGLDQTQGVFAIDREGKLAREPAFAGLSLGTGPAYVALGPRGRIHVLFRHESLDGGEGEEYLLARTKGILAAGLSAESRVKAMQVVRDLVGEDEARAAAARVFFVGLGLEALPLLRAARRDAAAPLAEEIDRLIARLAPSWVDRETYGE